MRDMYIGELLEGEVYETFDENMIYISKVRANYCEVYEKPRAQAVDWKWNLKTVKCLRRTIRTIMEVV